MNKAEYIKLKKSQLDKRTERPTCLKCYRPSRACFCEHIKPFNTKVRICLLMHPLEAKKSHIGTGRMARVALENSEIIVDPDFDKNERFNKLIDSDEYIPMLLYPGEGSININSELPSNSFSTKKTPLIFILDATWPCAKTMMKNTTKLHKLPKISFSNTIHSKFEIKQQPANYCLSTIESIYYLLSALEDQGAESLADQKETLLVALAKTVEFHQACANDPTLNNYKRDSQLPKKTTDRISSKKWETRSICYLNKNF